MGMAQRLLYVVVGVHIPAVILFGRSWARAISMHFSCMKTVWTRWIGLAQRSFSMTIGGLGSFLVHFSYFFICHENVASFKSCTITQKHDFIQKL
jgi:hypothetical protein